MPEREFEDQLSVEREKKHPFIQIMGVPGSGKTTFLELLKDRLGFQVIPEMPVTDHPIFEKYYEDPRKFSLGAQMLFAWESYLSLKGSSALGVVGVSDLLKNGPVVQEPPQQQNELYAMARKMKKKEWKLYGTFYHGLASADGIPAPDVLVYLRLSFATMLERIKERARIDRTRAAELNEKRSYWKRLWDLQEDWVARNPLNLNIVILDMDKFDFSKYKSCDESNEEILREFRHLSGI